ncbi:uncharacterized protein A1O9_06522 [Exophiala aquamarina CBS 119918]|uniref:Lipocalin-like domain-containing protein n=1 Tax=Exophiala aquamarina CBS 119918 TaxID=1182545 RepID=A0A072PFD9_9EURO|nr:uncharacterized protein A1O9_06522 [Exophiala aquamarina CBS 119918]KEF58596.1 hypothetical protein A1O9_06522 [Exophiala aquamarina CBS 119918]
MAAKVPFSEYRDRLAGCWELYSYKVYKDGQVSGEPHGDDPRGIAQISRDGYSSSHLADPARVKVLQKDRAWSAHTDADVAHYARGISMYCGQIQLFEDEEGLFWKTTVDIASDPSRIGGEQIRRVILSEEDGEEVMILRPLNAEANVVRVIPECTPLQFACALTSIVGKHIVSPQMAQIPS